MLSRFGRIQPFATPVDCSLPASSVLEILQARMLEWKNMPPPGDLPDPGIEPASLMSSALAGGLFTTSTTWKAPPNAPLCSFSPLRVRDLLKGGRSCTYSSQYSKASSLSLSLIFFSCCRAQALECKGSVIAVCEFLSSYPEA